MKKIAEVQQILKEVENFEKVKTFNFVTHECPVKNETFKVNLKYSINIEDDKDFDIFGYCENCKTLFYNQDFNSKSSF